MDCIFCKIANGEIPSTKVYEDETVIAFNDLNPQAPVQILIFPRRLISTKPTAHLLPIFLRLPQDSPKR